MHVRLKSLCIINAIRKSGVIAPLILKLGTRWMWVVSFTFRPPYPGRNDCCAQLSPRSLLENFEKRSILTSSGNWRTFRVARPLNMIVGVSQFTELKLQFARSAFLTDVSMENQVLWDVTPCRLVNKTDAPDEVNVSIFSVQESRRTSLSLPGDIA
jgi:hypothetical protein